MNWDPFTQDDERHASLLLAVQEFSGALIAGFRPGELPIWGVGVVNVQGEARPLLLVGSDQYGAPWRDRRSPYPRGFAIRGDEDLGEALERSRGWLLDQGVTRESLTGNILPEDTCLLLVDRPRALGAQGATVGSGQAIRRLVG